MKRTVSETDALALRSAIDAARGFPRTHENGSYTLTAVAIYGSGAEVDVMFDDADLAHVADAALRARVFDARRPERDRLPATALSPVSSTVRMLPVILLANALVLPDAIEKAPGEVHVLWDVAVDLGAIGTRYARTDGQREFVVQPVATIGEQHVAILWSAGRDDDPSESAYIAEMLAVAVAGGLVAEHWSCSRVDGLWMPSGLSAEMLAAWPAEWHSAGAPCVGPST